MVWLWWVLAIIGVIGSVVLWVSWIRRVGIEEARAWSRRELALRHVRTWMLWAAAILSLFFTALFIPIAVGEPANVWILLVLALIDIFLVRALFLRYRERRAT